MAAGAITRSHVRHEDAEHTVTLAQQCVDGASQAVTDIRGGRIFVQRATVAVMHHYQFAVRMLRDEVVSESL